MNKIFRTVKHLVLFFIFCSGITFAAAAQNGSEVEMADTLRSNGMIYVVVGVILIVLTGLILYLISVDRKVGKLEKQMRDEKK